MDGHVRTPNLWPTVAGSTGAGAEGSEGGGGRPATRGSARSGRDGRVGPSVARPRAGGGPSRQPPAARGGDAGLGRDDFERAIPEALLARARAGLDGATDPRTVRHLLDAARALKEKLTTSEDAAVEAELARGQGTPLRLSRAEMEALV